MPRGKGGMGPRLEREREPEPEPEPGRWPREVFLGEELPPWGGAAKLDMPLFRN